MKFTILISVCSILFFLQSCGKKPDEQITLGTETTRPPISPGKEEYLQKQKVSCKLGSKCPGYLAKIVVVVDKNRYRTCTGFLTDRQTVVTAASCLPKILRNQDQICRNEVYFFFPGKNENEPIRVGCNKIKLISNVDELNPSLRRDDLVYLELEKQMIRPILFYSREPVAEATQLTMWGLEQVEVNSSESLFTSQTCEVVHRTYISPLANSDSSPHLMAKSCGLTETSIGAPLIDRYGRLRGVAYSNPTKEMISFIESSDLLDGKKLDKMIYFSNMACAPSIYDASAVDPQECYKDISLSRLDFARRSLFQDKKLIDIELKKLSQMLTEKSKYISWKISLVDKPEVFIPVFQPVCFKDADIWMRQEFGRKPQLVTRIQKLPNFEFTPKLNTFAKLYFNVKLLSDLTYILEFSPWEIHYNSRSYLELRASDEQEGQRYRNIAPCP